jgi:hypothetical protein
LCRQSVEDESCHIPTLVQALSRERSETPSSSEIHRYSDWMFRVGRSPPLYLVAGDCAIGPCGRCINARSHMAASPDLTIVASVARWSCSARVMPRDSFNW